MKLAAMQFAHRLVESLKQIKPLGGDTCFDHAAIIDAIRGRDAEAARRAMAQHIQHVGELLVSHLEKQGFWSAASEYL